MDFAKSKPRKLNKRISKLTKLLGIIFGLILLTAIFIFYLITKSVSGRTNIILINDSITLLSLDNEQNSLNVISLPSTLYLDVVRGKGQLVAGSLFKFDYLSHYRGKLLKETIKDFFGVPIDGWIKLSSEQNPSNLKEFIYLKDNDLSPVNFNNFLNELIGQRTDLSIISLRRFYYQLSNVRYDKIDFLALSENNILTKEILPDGSKVLKADRPRLDDFLKNKFTDLQILKDNLNIIVLNGTQTSGLASRAARIIGNSGGHVIITNESQDKVDKCEINILPINKNKYTVLRLRNIFNCKITNNLQDEGRSDLTLLLGLDYEKEISGP